jgi:hypothetical protein
LKKILYSYGATEPLKIADTCCVNVKCKGESEYHVEFVVIEGQGQALLGRETALKLDVLHLPDKSSVNSVGDVTNIFDKYPECFNSVGKPKSSQLEIPIGDSLDPVIQPMRRILFNLRDRL